MATSTRTCDSLVEALKTLKSYEVETNSRFAVYTSTKDFGIQSAKNVYWEDRQTVKIGRIDFSGVPFIILGTKTFDCHFGKDRKIRAKEKRKALKIVNDHSSYSKGKKFLLCDSKKLNCKARCVMREVCMFDTYKVTDISTEESKFVAEDLLCRLNAGEDIPYQRHIITCLPSISDHTGHPVGPGEVVPEPIDSQMALKIKELVLNGITDPAVLKSQLYAHVKLVTNPAPHPANKRFYPTDKTIRNHIYKARNEKLGDDQSKIATWVSELKETTNDFVFCRLKSDTDENIPNVEVGSSFLFVHQSAQQKKLLKRYGCIVLLDATYKTTLFDLPLFFLVVKTNVDYQIVGFFITENETSQSIEEALTLMRENCFEYAPPYFMTDFDESEISGIEKVFVDSQVLICDFHREQAWERWTSTKNNAMGQKDDILRLLRKVAMAKNINIFNRAVESLRSSEIWQKNIKLQKYFERVWYPQHKVIDMKDFELEWLCNHLGHTASIHKLHYRSTSGFIERVNIGKLMLLQDLNVAGKYAGQRLQDIDLEGVLNCQTEVDRPTYEQPQDGQDVLEDEFYEDDQAPRKKRICIRQKWSKEEEEEIEKLFTNNFKTRKNPGLKDCTQAITQSRKNNGLIHQRNWETIKKKVMRMFKN